MFEAFAQARLWLANLDPAAPAVALMLGVFLTIYSIRRWFPRVWLWVEKTVPLVDSLDYRPAAQILWNVWQAWPAAALGAIMSALSTGGSGWGALKGAALGAAVAAIHKLAAAYKGKAGDPKPPDGAGSLGAAFAFALVAFALPLTACGFFRDSVWPVVAQCLPSPASLLSQVEVILLAGGDYESELLHLAQTAGKEAVVCAVQATMDKWGKPGISARAATEVAPAYARGKAFLKTSGNAQ